MRCHMCFLIFFFLNERKEIIEDILFIFPVIFWKKNKSCSLQGMICDI